ncbi:MAG: tRNA epoxyqueuosine(34) reductase QueG [Gemmatimonadaceae bacterium]|nr:tRNA epoxyqueuosine(34) reductase QueG [Gemmatimonadaceae bacterium]
MTEATTAPARDAAGLARLAKTEAYALGFDLCGITALGPMDTAPAFDAWIEDGRAGTMHYLERGAEKRHDSRRPLPGTTHAIVVALDYGGREPSGPVARYARGDDYHDVMESKLRALHARLEEAVGAAVPGKPYVDTGPLLERDLARRAGLGWFGKNTNLLNPRMGSFFFLGCLVVELDLATDAPFESDHCGTCTRCIEACPTAAITAPRELDATRCISYLTIELKGEISEEFRAPMGELIYGCDICQEVCPFNIKFAQAFKVPEFAPREFLAGKDSRTLARDILALTQEDFSVVFKGSPMKRAKLNGLQRNAAVVLGNVRTSDDAAAPLNDASRQAP